MIRSIAAAALILALASPSLAQQSAVEQALGQRLMAEINANIQAAAMIIDLQRQLAAAQARVKELEPKADAPPK